MPTRNAIQAAFRLPAAGYSFGAAIEERLERLLSVGGEKDLLGHSREGRPIHGYRWRVGGASPAPTGSAAQAATKPTPGLLFVSLIHPMEWIGLETHLALLESWLLPPAGYRAGASLEQAQPHLPAGTQILSLPMVNPDGCARVEESLRTGRRRWVRGNAARIDLNRNFPRHHRRRPRAIDWWPIYRPGPSGLSEPETRALADWIQGQPIDFSLSLHSFGGWFFYPPSAAWGPEAATARHREVIRRVLRSPTDGSTGPRYRESQLGRWSPLFRAYGTEIDFFQSETNGLSFLVEVSRGGIFRWGLSRALHPFFAFNPPHPGRETARLVPLLQRLAWEAVASSLRG